MKRKGGGDFEEQEEKTRGGGRVGGDSKGEGGWGKGWEGGEGSLFELVQNWLNFELFRIHWFNWVWFIEFFCYYKRVMPLSKNRWILYINNEINWWI